LNVDLGLLTTSSWPTHIHEKQ